MDFNQRYLIVDWIYEALKSYNAKQIQMQYRGKKVANQIMTKDKFVFLKNVRYYILKAYTKLN